LRLIFREPDVFFNTITKIEVSGFQRLIPSDKIYFEAIFASLTEINLTKEIAQKAIELRQAKKMSLGDAIVGATAFVFDLELITRNISDFAHIPDLKLSNPIV